MSNLRSAIANFEIPIYTRKTLPYYSRSQDLRKRVTSATLTCAMEQNRGYRRRGNFIYRPSEEELCACAQACNVDRETIESVTLAHPEQQRRLQAHLTTGSYMETIVFQSIQKPDRIQKDFLITASNAFRFENCLLRTRLVQYGERVLQVVLGDRAEWTEPLDSSVYMGNNSVARMNYRQRLFRYAFLEDGDKPTYFVWTSRSTRSLDMPKLTLLSHNSQLQLP